MNKKTKAKSRMHVKKGDTVKIISGSNKNQVGIVIKVLTKTSQVIIKDLNLKTKHIRAKQQGESGRIISFEAPIHSSNVTIYNENIDK